jgi:hypothetical protein
MQDRISRERLDLNLYESQPLAALTKSSSFAAKCNLDIVPSYHSQAPNQLPSPRFRPHAALTLLSIFINPKALHSTDVLHSFSCSPLSFPDRTVPCRACRHASPRISHATTALSMPSGRCWRTGGRSCTADPRVCCLDRSGGRVQLKSKDSSWNTRQGQWGRVARRVGMARSHLRGACGRFRKAASSVFDFVGRRGEETMGHL